MMIIVSDACTINESALALPLALLELVQGNCDKFYFTFELEVRMWVQIYQIFEGDRIPIRHLSNKSDLNTDKPNSLNILQKVLWNQLLVLVSFNFFRVNILLKCLKGHLRVFKAKCWRYLIGLAYRNERVNLQ